MLSYKAFVINLKKDRERMLFMEKQLLEAGIPFEKFSAIYGKNFEWTSEYDEELTLQKNGYTMSFAERGASLSHRILYEKMLNSNLDYMLIFEDDVLIPKNFKEIIEREIKKNQKNKTWEYLSFDYIEPNIFLISHWISSIFLNYKMKIQNQHPFYKIKFFVYSLLKAFYILPLFSFEILRNYFYKYIYKNGKAVNFYRPLYLAGAYIITKEAAEKLIPLNTPIIYPADRLPNEARKFKNLKFKAYAPTVVFQQRKKFESNIVPKNHEK